MAGLNALTIKVNRFGPLEDVSFELAPLMIFTGMSSTGKSYANYLVYYYLSSVINTMLSDHLASCFSVGRFLGFVKKRCAGIHAEVSWG